MANASLISYYIFINVKWCEQDSKWTCRNIVCKSNVKLIKHLIASQKRLHVIKVLFIRVQITLFPKKIQIKSALIVCNSLLSPFAAAAVKQFCDSRKEKKVSSAPIHWSLCVLWCERAAVRGAGGGGEWRQRRGISRGMHILVYSQQLHLGEQRGAWPPLRSEPGIFSPSLWKNKKTCDDSLWLAISAANPALHICR